MIQALELSQQQRACFELLEQTHDHVFVTGRAGTGKSALLSIFCAKTRKRVSVVAPTGIAALGVGGQTIHSLFRLPIGFIDASTLTHDSRLSTLLRHIDTVVIDEVSMVRADVIDAIDERLRQARGNSAPFGGVQVLMFGDPYQLPPVVDDETLLAYFEEHYGGAYFFNAHVWKQAHLHTYCLTEIFRQKERRFKDLLNAAREGTMSDEQLAQLNERCVVAPDGAGVVPHCNVITLATTNALVAQINQAHLAELPGERHEYPAVITGKLERSAFPTEEILQLKRGAQVILLKNDPDRRWVNGTLAVVHELSETEVKVRINGIVYALQKETWEKIRYSYDRATGTLEKEVISSFTQFPVRLARAMTIHKSQGKTYSAIIVDLTHDAFAPGQVYVALSRCTSLSGLYLTMPLKHKHLFVDPKIQAFMRSKQEYPITMSPTGVS